MTTFRKSFGLQKNFALISLFSVVAFASDRVLITLFGSSKDLATFTLASQVFNPGFAMLAAAGLAVWGQFASSSDLGIYSYRLRTSVVFSALGFCLSIVLSICLPIYFHFVAPEALSVDWALAIFFCLFLVMQAFQYPIGYFMLHNDGDKAQMLFLLVACLMKIPLAILFSSLLGVSGIILSSFLIVLIAQILPGLITLKAHGRLTW